MSTGLTNGIAERWQKAALGTGLGLLLAVLGVLIWNPGRTVAKCPSTSADISFVGISGGLLILSDGCNHYELPLLTVLGGLLMAVGAGYAIASVTHHLR